jgi:hypothetical protein
LGSIFILSTILIFQDLSFFIKLVFLAKENNEKIKKYYKLKKKKAIFSILDAVI